MLNNLFDQNVYVISLPEANKRFQFTKKNLEEAGFNNIVRFNAVDGKNKHKIYEIEKILELEYNYSPESKWNKRLDVNIISNSARGNTLSHLLLLKKCVDENLDYIIICEDDCVLTTNFKEKCTRSCNKIPIDFDIIYLGNQDNKKDINQSNIIYQCNELYVLKKYTNCVHGIIVSNKGALQILDLIKYHDFDTNIFFSDYTNSDSMYYLMSFDKLIDTYLITQYDYSDSKYDVIPERSSGLIYQANTNICTLQIHKVFIYQIHNNNKYSNHIKNINEQLSKKLNYTYIHEKILDTRNKPKISLINYIIQNISDGILIFLEPNTYINDNVVNNLISELPETKNGYLVHDNFKPLDFVNNNWIIKINDFSKKKFIDLEKVILNDLSEYSSNNDSFIILNKENNIYNYPFHSYNYYNKISRDLSIQDFDTIMNNNIYIITVPESGNRFELTKNNLIQAGFTNIIKFDGVYGKYPNQIKEAEIKLGLKYTFPKKTKWISSLIKCGNRGKVEDICITNGQRGLALSHLLLLQKCIDENMEYICVFEDDCICTKDFRNKARMLWNNTPNNFDILYIGNTGNKDDMKKYKKYTEINDMYIVNQSSYMTHCLIYSNQGARNILNIFKNHHLYSDILDNEYYIIDTAYVVMEWNKLINCYKWHQFDYTDSDIDVRIDRSSGLVYQIAEDICPSRIHIN